MSPTTSFGDLNSGLQAGIVNGNVSAQFLQSEFNATSGGRQQININGPGGSQVSGDMGRNNVIAGHDINISYITEIRPLAESLYRSLFSPSELFHRVQNDLGLLISVLNATEHHIPCHANDIHRRELNAALEECHHVLLELSEMKTHFDSMDRQTQFTWERLKWGLNDLEGMRTRLSTYVQNLTMLNTNMIMSSQANVDAMLKKFIHEIRTGIRDSSSVSSISDGPRDSSDEDAWNEVRKELLGVGITPELFLQHREFITTTLRSSLNQGDQEGEFSFEQHEFHDIHSVPHRREVSSRSLPPSASSGENQTDREIGFLTQEADDKTIYGVTFDMWVNTPQQGKEIEESLHIYSRMISHIYYEELYPLRTLHSIIGWRMLFPRLASLIDDINSPLDCKIILIDAKTSLMNDFPPLGSRLGIHLDLDFGHPIDGDRMESWNCSTRIYEEGRKVWESCNCLPDPQSSKVKVLFEPDWWAKLFTELTQDKRIAEDSGQLESIDFTDCRTRRVIGSLSAVQEIERHRVLSLSYHRAESERMAILVWRFGQASIGEAGITKWRVLTPPSNSYA